MATAAAIQAILPSVGRVSSTRAAWQPRPSLSRQISGLAARPRSPIISSPATAAVWNTAIASRADRNFRPPCPGAAGFDASTCSSQLCLDRVRVVLPASHPGSCLVHVTLPHCAIALHPQTSAAARQGVHLDIGGAEERNCAIVYTRNIMEITVIIRIVPTVSHVMTISTQCR